MPKGGNTGSGGTVKKAPDAIDDALTIQWSETSLTSYKLAFSAVLGNDLTANKNDVLTITAVQGLSGGAVELRSDGLYLVPANPFNPDISFKYTVSDGKGGTDTATATVDFRLPQPANQPPVARDEVIVVSVAEEIFGPPVGRFLFDLNTPRLLNNDSDPESGALSVVGINEVRVQNFSGTANIILETGNPGYVGFEFIKQSAFSDVLVGTVVDFNYVVADDAQNYATAHAEIVFIA